MSVVVDLGSCRDLLKVWTDVRAMLLKSGASGLAVTVRQNGREAVLFAGDYRDDPEAALRVAMAMSWEITKATFRRP